MDKYFVKFPQMYYNGTLCKDISRSVRLTPESRAKTSLFHPLQIDAGFRPDNLADAYYQDPEMDWVIWLTNDIVDPFYEWYLSEREFENFIVTKYGSYEDAQKQIMYYRTNWYKLDETIPVEYYENSLTFDLKKYFTPVFGVGNRILNYKRREEDWTTNTNRIVQYNGFTASGEFVEGEIMDIWASGLRVGQATVITANLTSVITQHVSGNSVANSTGIKVITGQTSNANWQTGESINLQINLSDEEAIYWDPISALDLEIEDNEKKKNLIIMNADFALDVSEQIRLKLKDTV